MKTTQNISTLIGQIGENLVLFHLYANCKINNNLEVFKNYSEAGYDVGIRNINTGEKVCIEVKTRQHLVTTTKISSKESIHFTLTENEYNSCDFLIGLWLERNIFFIVPKNQLVKTKSKTKSVYKFVTRQLKNGCFSEKGFEYLNKWNHVINSIKVEGELTN